MPAAEASTRAQHVAGKVAAAEASTRAQHVAGKRWPGSIQSVRELKFVLKYA